MQSLQRGFCLALLVVSCFLGLNAQEVTGNIFGTITDPTGAAVPNATVVVSATDRGFVARSFQTNAEGAYSATLLPVGIYSVSVEAPGFKKTTRANIELSANQKYTADLTLEVGDVAQEITVEAAPVQVELQSAQQAGTINGTQVRQLALNNRHFAQLVVLQPGVTSNLSDQIYLGTTNPAGGNNIVGVSINGTRQSQNNWTIDGADNVDRGTNITIQQYPSIDAIEEIKIVRTPYSAEFGRAAGGQISVITRSGTNELHGTVYEFFRNDKLNANNFFNNANRVARPPLRYNNFGYTAGGPVVIPRLYDGRRRTFFFFSHEFRRTINYNAQNVQIPTLEERQGIFSTPVCIALSADRTTCAETGTRVTNINPVAAAYIQDIYSKLPAPTNGNNLFVPLRGVFNARQEIIKVDHNFGEKLMLSGRFLHDSIPTIEPAGLFTNNYTPGVATTETQSPGRSFVLRATSSLSPTLYNEAGWAWSKGGIFSTPVGLAARANSPNINPNLVFPANPDRVPTLAFGTGGFSGVASYGPYENFSYNHSIFDNATKVLGNHTLKFGGQMYIYRKNENQLADNAGGYTIANSPRPATAPVAQQGWAYFLLGDVGTFTQTSQDLTADIRSKSFEADLQDDWRIRPNLTLNLGLRYSNFRQPTDANGLLTNFDPSRFDPSRAFRIDPATGNRIAGTGDPFNGVFQGDKNSPFGAAVARQNNLDFAPRVGFAWDPWGSGLTSFRGGYGIFYDSPLVGTLEQNIGVNPTEDFSRVSIANTRLDDPASGSPVVNLAPGTLRGWDPDFETPYVQQWSFEIQRQFTRTSVGSVAYVGTKGTHLTGIVDINQVAPGVAAAAGLVPAGGYINSAALRARLNPYRPYQGYNAINMILTQFDSSYHGLQTQFTQRFRRSNIGVAYTWSKNLTNNASDRSNAPQSSYNWSADRGLASLDRRHVLTASYVLPLPTLTNAPGIVRHTLGNWELSGIFTWNTGVPLTITSSLGNDPGGLGSANNVDSAAGVRPDVIGDPKAGSNIRTVDRWFNTGAFAEVPQGQFRPGNAGRGIVESPGLTRWDFSLFKYIPVTERVQLQLRGEAFNVLNHTNFNAPNVALGNINFGRITTARDPRQIQVAAKLVF
ncbi:MAG TPA: carboxypeptidase regulatory-like domain-containing protein [Bryobacteraceae bacterium]|nr:carboxypeptidase regulatory-like domain-containing protein [Bryobacteraceae bacterium]